MFSCWQPPRSLPIFLPVVLPTSPDLCQPLPLPRCLASPGCGAWRAPGGACAYWSPPRLRVLPHALRLRSSPRHFTRTPDPRSRGSFSIFWMNSGPAFHFLSNLILGGRPSCVQSSPRALVTHTLWVWLLSRCMPGKRSTPELVPASFRFSAASLALLGLFTHCMSNQNHCLSSPKWHLPLWPHPSDDVTMSQLPLPASWESSPLSHFCHPLGHLTGSSVGETGHFLSCTSQFPCRVSTDALGLAFLPLGLLATSLSSRL